MTIGQLADRGPGAAVAGRSPGPLGFLRPLFSVRRVLIALSFLASVLLLLSAGFSLDRQVHTLLESTSWILHTRDVELALTRLQFRLDAAESAVRGYVLTGKPEYLAPFEAAKSNLSAETAAIRALIADDWAQTSALDTLQSVIEEKLGILQQGVEARHQGPEAVNALVAQGQGKRLMDEINRRLASMIDNEEGLLNARRQQSEADVDRTLHLARTIATAGMLLLTCAFAWVAVSMHMRGVGEVLATRLANDLDRQRRDLIRAIEAKEAADRVREQREGQMREEQMMVTLGRLAGGLAHVLNNAMSLILGNAELIESLPGLDRESRACASDLRQGALKAAKLTDQFRSFGQRQFLVPERVELNPTVRQLEELMAPRLGERIATTVQCDPQVPAVAVDRNQLLAALAALVENAADAMPEGSALRLETRRRRLPDQASRAAETALAARDYAEVVVADTGRGMSETVREHAFEPFYTTKDLSQGAGLGLSMVHGFIKQSGGHVALASRENQGTEVSILLPADIGAERPSPAG